MSRYHYKIEREQDAKVIAAAFDKLYPTYIGTYIPNSLDNREGVKYHTGRT